MLGLNKSLNNLNNMSFSIYLPATSFKGTHNIPLSKVVSNLAHLKAIFSLMEIIYYYHLKSKAPTFPS